jgi:hypothetical protein
MPLPRHLSMEVARRLRDSGGVAEKVARALLAHPETTFALTDFKRHGVSAAEHGRALAALRAFVELGWCESDASRWRVRAGMPCDLPVFLQGMAAACDANGPHVDAAAIITMPGKNSRLAGVLPSVGPAHAAMSQTKEAFHDLAANATRSLVVMSPFLNLSGLEWAADLFRKSLAAKKHFIVRGTNETISLLRSNANALIDGQVKVFSYRIASNDGGYETFHAKLVVADGEAAYVGSANMLDHSRPSMELGLIVRGKPMAAIVTLVEAVQRIAESLPLERTLDNSADGEEAASLYPTSAA